MLSSHTCGELRLKDAGTLVTLCGWLQRSRDLGGMTHDFLVILLVGSKCLLMPLKPE